MREADCLDLVSYNTLLKTISTEARSNRGRRCASPSPLMERGILLLQASAGGPNSGAVHVVLPMELRRRCGCFRWTGSGCASSCCFSAGRQSPVLRASLSLRVFFFWRALHTVTRSEKSWKSVQAGVLSEALMPLLNLHGVLVFVAANDALRLPPAFTEILPAEFPHLSALVSVCDGLVVVGWLGRGTTGLHCTHHVYTHHKTPVHFHCFSSFPPWPCSWRDALCNQVSCRGHGWQAILPSRPGCPL